jgi:hypothetical protein
MIVYFYYLFLVHVIFGEMLEGNMGNALKKFSS